MKVRLAHVLLFLALLGLVFLYAWGAKLAEERGEKVRQAPVALE